MKTSEKIQYINTSKHGPVNYRKGQKIRNALNNGCEIHEKANITGNNCVAKLVASKKIEQRRKADAKFSRQQLAEEIKLAKAYEEEQDLYASSDNFFDMNETQIATLNELETKLDALHNELQKVTDLYQAALKKAKISDIEAFEQKIEDALYCDAVKNTNEFAKLSKQYCAVTLYEKKKTLNNDIKNSYKSIDSIYIYGDEKSLEEKTK